MKNVLLLILFSWLGFSGLFAQCELAIDQVDEFDSTRTVVSKTINIGYLIPSQYMTEEGITMIEEAKLLFSYTENDSINSFFMTLAVAEREYLSISADFNVLLKLSDDQVIGLLNVPDRGQFDRNTNMRVYQHTCIIPLDVFYTLTHYTIDKIRIEYKNSKRTITLLPEQQEEVRKAVRCVGEALKLFPIRP